MGLRLDDSQLAELSGLLAAAGLDGPLAPAEGGTIAAVYLSGDRVVRVTAADAELTCRRYHAWAELSRAGVAVMRPALAQPIVAAGVVAAVFERLDNRGPLDPRRAGRALRALHDVPVAVVDGLPTPLDVAGTIAQLHRLAAAGLLEPAEADAAARVCARAEQLLGEATVVCHGDCWPKNWVATPDPHLVDIDTLGPGRAGHDWALLVAGVVGIGGPDAAFALMDGYGPGPLGLSGVADVVWAHDIAFTVGPVWLVSDERRADDVRTHLRRGPKPAAVTTSRL